MRRIKRGYLAAANILAITALCALGPQWVREAAFFTHDTQDDWFYPKPVPDHLAEELALTYARQALAHRGYPDARWKLAEGGDRPDPAKPTYSAHGVPDAYFFRATFDYGHFRFADARTDGLVHVDVSLRGHRVKTTIRRVR